MPRVSVEVKTSTIYDALHRGAQKEAVQPKSKYFKQTATKASHEGAIKEAAQLKMKNSKKPLTKAAFDEDTLFAQKERELALPENDACTGVSCWILNCALKVVTDRERSSRHIPPTPYATPRYDYPSVSTRACLL